MSLSDEEIAEFWLHRKNIHGGDLMLQLRDYARAIERAATIAAMRRCAEMVEKLGDEYQRQEGSLYSELRTDAESGVRSAEYEIRAEIAKLEAEK